jgi:phosphohistidine phosphatase
MGKTLFIVRHAMANAAEPEMRDIDRILSSEGLQQSSRMGVFLSKKNASISAIISSNAVRAIQTSEQIADQLGYDISKIISDEDLYEASVRILLNKIHEINNYWSEVVVVGHNPVLSYFVEYLTGHHFDGMAAGSLVKISSAVKDWTEIAQENSSFEYYVSPDDFVD